MSRLTDEQVKEIESEVLAWIAEHHDGDEWPAVYHSFQRLLLDRKALLAWQPIETAPRDGRDILCTDGSSTRVCRLKVFPRPLTDGDDMSRSRAGDTWEYFRDDQNAPGQSWSMIPTHWQPIPESPK